LNHDLPFRVKANLVGEAAGAVQSTRTNMDTLVQNVLSDLAQMARGAPGAADARGAGDAALAQLVESLVGGASLDGRAIERIAATYRKLGAPNRMRHHLLRLLASDGRPAALTAFVELVSADPPASANDAALAFAPLLRERFVAAEALFPKLLGCLEHPATAALTLDLANFFVRSRRVTPHPAVPRVAQLAALLGGLVSRLARLQERPREFGPPDQVQAIVGESLGLVVALCDALALIGDTSVTGKLHQALELTHRRVRTEAAYALARLGDEAGIDALARMAAEPSARSRALACLEELGQAQRANEADRSPVARAEGELAAWLAQPTQFGIPPRSIELVDSRRQHWPGFAGGVDCYLFQFEYMVGSRARSNIAIVGPTLHALGADLADLPPSDIYAAYAGWSAEHDEIQETAADQFSPEQRAAWGHAAARLAAGGYDEITPVVCGRFFGETHWVALARRGGLPGMVVDDGRHIEWSPRRAGRLPLGPAEIHQIHKGRKLLRAFNGETMRD
jgi:hypothetical protein